MKRSIQQQLIVFSPGLSNLYKTSAMWPMMTALKSICLTKTTEKSRRCWKSSRNLMGKYWISGYHQMQSRFTYLICRVMTRRIQRLICSSLMGRNSITIEMSNAFQKYLEPNKLLNHKNSSQACLYKGIRKNHKTKEIKCLPTLDSVWSAKHMVTSQTSLAR
jgi:hypothetical protein